MKVLVSDKFSPEGLKIFEQAEGIELEYHPGISPEALLKAVEDVDALVVRGGTQVSEEVFRAAKKLRVVGRAGIGIENMDLAAANRKGVVVMNTPFGSTTTTAEHTIAMLMALARQIPEASRSTKAGRWEKDRFLGVEISRQDPGRHRRREDRPPGGGAGPGPEDAGPRLRPLPGRRDGAPDRGRAGGVRRTAGPLRLHHPAHPPQCRNRGAARRGGAARWSSPAAGSSTAPSAAWSTRAPWPRPSGPAGWPARPSTSSPRSRRSRTTRCWTLDQVICTPHLRAATVDAQINVTVQVARQIVDFLQRGMIVNALNVPSVSAELLAEIRPYIDLAERLGSFQAQLCARGLQSVTVEYAGDGHRAPHRTADHGPAQGAADADDRLHGQLRQRPAPRPGTGHPGGRGAQQHHRGVLPTSSA